MLGITPACAGKSEGGMNDEALPEDHPRVCGEKRDLPDLIEQFNGSPPRVRGKDHVAEVIAHGTGITPACAGKSSTMSGAVPTS